MPKTAHADIDSEKEKIAKLLGYTDFDAMSTDIVDNHKTFNCSQFGLTTVTFVGYEWWAVYAQAYGTDVQLTLWMKPSLGNYTFSDGTWGYNATYAAANDWRYCWLRSALNMGQTSDNGDYYGAWPNNSKSNATPTKFDKDTPPNTSHVAPTAFTKLSSIVGNQFIIPGGDYGDYVWLPSREEAIVNSTWGTTNTHLQSGGTSTAGYFWTRSRSSTAGGWTVYIYYGGTPAQASSENGYVARCTRPAININLSTVDETTDFAVNPDPDKLVVVPDPVLSTGGTTATAVFDGNQKTFTLQNISSSVKYDLGNLTQISYNATTGVLVVSATNAGTYEVPVSLADSSKTIWESGGNDAQKITITITPKPVTVNWSTQNHEEGSGADSYYFMLPSLNVTSDVQDLFEVKYYLKDNYNTGTGTATGSPVTTFEEDKDYYAVAELKSGLDKSNYSFSGNLYYAFNTSDSREAVTVSLLNSGETYDGNQHPAKVKAVTADGTELVIGTDIDFQLTYYKDGDPVYDSGSTDAPTNAGTYKLVVQIKPANNDTYKVDDSIEFSYVINQIDPVCNPTADDSSLTEGDDLPDITAGSSDTSGTYAWVAGQTAKAGTNSYTYTFTPTDPNYKTVTGTITLTAAELPDDTDPDDTDPNNPDPDNPDPDNPDPDNPDDGDDTDPSNPGGSGTTDPSNPGGSGSGSTDDGTGDGSGSGSGDGSGDGSSDGSNSGDDGSTDGPGNDNTDNSDDNDGNDDSDDGSGAGSGTTDSDNNSDNNSDDKNTNGSGSFGKKILNFLKKNWWWLLLALAAIVLLIIIIAVASRRRKDDDEKKAKKEEKARREEEQIRAIEQQAPIAAASMAMAQPVQPIMQPVQQPVQPIVMQQPNFDLSILAEIRADVAELKARQNMQPQYMPQSYVPSPAPATAPAPQPTIAPAQAMAGGIDYHSLYAEERARAAEAKIAEDRIRTEERARAAEQRAMLAEERYWRGGSQSGTQSANLPNNGNAIPAEVVVALLQAVNKGGAPVILNAAPAQAKPAVPADAVVTTTTTVDTTKNKPNNFVREENFDVDGFYDKYE